MAAQVLAHGPAVAGGRAADPGRVRVEPGEHQPRQPKPEADVYKSETQSYFLLNSATCFGASEGDRKKLE